MTQCTLAEGGNANGDLRLGSPIDHKPLDTEEFLRLDLIPCDRSGSNAKSAFRLKSEIRHTTNTGEIRHFTTLLNSGVLRCCFLALGVLN